MSVHVGPAANGITVRPMGDRAVLLDLTAAIAGAGGSAAPAAVAAALRTGDAMGTGDAMITEPTDGRIVDVVPAADTVLVRYAGGPGTRAPHPDAVGRLVARAADALAAGRAGTDLAPVAADGVAELVVPVRYDGPDLAEVAAAAGLTTDDVIAAHTGTVWTAAFVGFAPGFAYLTGGDPRLRIPRRAQSRPSIPAGSVALAGGYSAIYPRASPGGWQLIGTTGLSLWDRTAEPPARIRPGQRVRFVAVDAGAGTAEGAAAGVFAADRVPDSPAPDAPVGLRVVRTGPRALLQDGGRVGRAADGVGPSGPADRVAHARANQLVGNPADATAIECTLGGLLVEATRDLIVAVTGATCRVEIEGRPAVLDAAVAVPAGSQLRLRAPGDGLRNYLAVGGGLLAPTVLGSSSTDTLAGLGPEPLRVGDRLLVPERRPPDRRPVPTIGPPTPPADRTGRTEHTVLSVLFGPRDDWFTDPSALLRGEWVVSPQSDRVALRLDRPTDPAPADERPPLTRSRVAELPSEGLVRGAIQVPPSGQPVLFLADHPLTGGYPVIAVVADAEVDRAGQLRPGQRLRFAATGGETDPPH